MEVERINDNVIKVLIGADDLAERGVNFIDLISDQALVEEFFYGILEEVDVERQFFDSDAVTFQVIPNSKGLELYITRTDAEEMEQLWTQNLSDILKGENKKKEITKDAAIQELEEELHDEDEVSLELEEHNLLLANLPQVVRFDTLEDFIKCARDMKDSVLKGDLYQMEMHYYFAIQAHDEIEVGTQEYYDALKMYDYAETRLLTKAVLDEYGQLLYEENALHYFGEFL